MLKKGGKKMKRILGMLVIFAAFLFGDLMAQSSITVQRNGTKANFTLTAADTILNTNTLRKTIVLSAKQSVQLYSVRVDIDSISGTPAHTIALQGSMDNTNWTGISSVSWAGSSADTAFMFTDIATGIAWPFVSVLVTGSSTSKSQLTGLASRWLDEVK